MGISEYDEDRWKRLPAPIRLADTTTGQAAKEPGETLLPDSTRYFDREWVVRWYG
jgi:hypothetical protein